MIEWRRNKKWTQTDTQIQSNIEKMPSINDDDGNHLYDKCGFFLVPPNFACGFFPLHHTYRNWFCSHFFLLLLHIRVVCFFLFSLQFHFVFSFLNKLYYYLRTFVNKTKIWDTSVELFWALVASFRFFCAKQTISIRSQIASHECYCVVATMFSCSNTIVNTQSIKWKWN